MNLFRRGRGGCGCTKVKLKILGSQFLEVYVVSWWLAQTIYPYSLWVSFIDRGIIVTDAFFGGRLEILLVVAATAPETLLKPSIFIQIPLKDTSREVKMGKSCMDSITIYARNYNEIAKPHKFLFTHRATCGYNGKGLRPKNDPTQIMCAGLFVCVFPMLSVFCSFHF